MKKGLLKKVGHIFEYQITRPSELLPSCLISCTCLYFLLIYPYMIHKKSYCTPYLFNKLYLFLHSAQSQNHGLSYLFTAFQFSCHYISVELSLSQIAQLVTTAKHYQIVVFFCPYYQNHVPCKSIKFLEICITSLLLIKKSSLYLPKFFNKDIVCQSVDLSRLTSSLS